MLKKFIFIFVICLSAEILAAQVVPKVTGSKVTQADAQKALNFHNKVRKDVGVGPLIWSAELSKFAQEWATHLANDSCNFEHRPTSGVWQRKYGENLYSMSGGYADVFMASESWYSEIADYKYGILTNDNWQGVGHYTQMVWRNTTQLGMGIARCKTGQIIIVANYNPSGNYLGEKPY